MPRQADVSLNERAFILQALAEGIRLDGRGLEDIRQLEVSFGDEFGVADVCLGKTRVLVRVSAEITNPSPDRQFDGIFNITTELSPMASPAFETGRPTDQETILSRLLEKAIRRSAALDTESLCILAGQKCWSVRVDVHVLDHDGGLIDASCVAVIAALRHFRRPEVKVEGEKVIVFTAEERVPVPLGMLHFPYCVTASFFVTASTRRRDHEGVGEEHAMVVIDATLQESRISAGEVVVTANKGGEVCQVAKLGGLPVDAVLLLRCVEMAAKKAGEVSKIVDGALKGEEYRRDKGGFLEKEGRAENER